MNRKTAPYIDIVRHEDKEAKIQAFVRTVVDQLAVRPSLDASAKSILMVARSIDSPVAKAIAALVREGTLTDPVRAIFAIVPHRDQGAGDALPLLAHEQAGRLLRDVRLFDVHEQLVLGLDASWVGDCMRRDPMKRDAYEAYAADCRERAGWARVSFDRLWAIGEPTADEPAQMAGGIVAQTCIPALVAEEAKGPANSTGG